MAKSATQAKRYENEFTFTLERGQICHPSTVQTQVKLVIDDHPCVTRYARL
jgi:hypothetical protein